MKKVLILGNGISRLSYQKEINEWQDEIWGSNFVYKELANKLTRLTGHTEHMRTAEKYKKEKGYTFLIYGIDIFPTCEIKFHKDSGTFLVAQALYEGYTVYCCGYDLGGKDVYAPNHDKYNQNMWVQRWRLLASKYTLQNVNFIGYDHKPYILSNSPINLYSLKYQRNEPHILEKKYLEVYQNFKEPIIEKGEENECEEVQRHMSTNRGVRFN